MDNESKTRVEKLIKGAQGRGKTHIETELNGFKGIYDGLSPNEKCHLKAWLVNTAIFKDKVSVARRFISLQVLFLEPIGDDKYRGATMSVAAARNAVECWDRNESYMPKSVAEFLD